MRAGSPWPVRNDFSVDATASPGRFPIGVLPIVSATLRWGAGAFLLVVLGSWLSAPLGIAAACGVVLAITGWGRLSEPDWAAIAFGAAWLLSSACSPLQSSNPWPMLACLAIFLGVSRTARDGRFAVALVTAVTGIAVSALTMAALESWVVAHSERVAVLSSTRHWGGYPEIGLLAVMALPLPFAVALLAPRRIAALAAACLTAFAGLGLLLSYARASWIAVLLAASVLLPLARWRRVLIVALFAVASAAVAWISLPLVRAYTELLLARNNTATSYRVGAWELAVELWRGRWLIGWGAGAYSEAFRLYAPPADPLVTLGAQYHAHNTLLHIAVESGLVGCATVLWLGIAVGRVAARDLRREAGSLKPVRWGLLVALVGTGLRMQVDFFDPGAAPLREAITLAVLAGVSVGLGVRRSPDRRVGRTRSAGERRTLRTWRRERLALPETGPA